jgi:hypothetical protein
VAGGSLPLAARRGVSVRMTAPCRVADMRTLFVALLTIVGVGLAYLITLGLLHR